MLDEMEWLEEFGLSFKVEEEDKSVSPAANGISKCIKFLKKYYKVKLFETDLKPEK